ncbi:Serine hydrolase-like protein 2 [Halocaridina rubra]|uniref:Serine hydrolase-like protein 2 n=1 Tax=Halocaridina rubra TaxID=373956 RepID=A0AAN8XD32_HALRR
MPGPLAAQEKRHDDLITDSYENCKEDKTFDVPASPVKRPRSIKSCAWEWEEVEIDIGWGTLRGKARGSGSRLVLGLHGWLDNANTFDLVAPSLPEDTRFLSLDLPGHGRSDHFSPGFIYDPRGYAGAVKKAMTAYGWERFVLLGHSMGAVVGILYAAAFPEDVEAFISVDIIKPWSSQPDKYASLFKKYFDQYFDNENKASKPPLIYEEEELVTKTIEGSKSLDERGARILLQRGARKTEDGKGLVLLRDLRVKAFFIGFMTYEGWLELARSIECPLLILKATEGHYYNETQETYNVVLAAFQENSRHFSYKEVEGKHHIHLTNSEIVSGYINNFLRESNVALLNGASIVA